MTQGAVSRHVATLEAWLGVKLFERAHQGIALTPSGAAYFATVRAAFEQIDRGTKQLRQLPDDRRLRIKLPPTFAIRWFVPRLARFHALHPGIDVQITTSHDPVDFDRDELDAGIHSERQPPTGPGVRLLFGETLVIVCSPALLERGPPLRTPADLADHVLLCSTHRPNDWPTWLAAAGIDSINGKGMSRKSLVYWRVRFRELPVGTQVAVEFVRDGRRKTANLLLADRIPPE